VNETTQRVRVLTWNVWWRFGPQWRERQPRILQTLRDVDPDLVMMQEVWGSSDTSQVDELAAELGWHAAYAAPSYPPAPDPAESPDQTGISLGVGLLSRWPISAARPVTLPARHRPYAPVSLVATVDHPAGPMQVVATCLEYEPAYNDDRVAQGRQLVELATDPALDGPLPVVVAGDLNAAPDSPVLRPLQDVLFDAWTAAGGDPTAVSLPSSHPSAPVEAEELIDRRIYDIFFRPGQLRSRVTAESARLAGEAVDGMFPSDHRAVVVDLTWRATS
jgi:endonuclease/exonuclease/phosphatase family metal-dependent hydrolase